MQRVRRTAHPRRPRGRSWRSTLSLGALSVPRNTVMLRASMNTMRFRSSEVGHPAWYHNLIAEPRVVIEVSGSRLAARAATAEGEERSRLWARTIGRYPNFTEYQEGVTRELPIVVLRATS